MAEQQPSTLVIGMGNPFLGDDGVGWHIAELVRREVADRLPGVDIDCAALGGLSLMERLIGYDRAIVIDALNTGRPSGTIRVLPLDALPELGGAHMRSVHDTSLHSALRLGEALGIHLPAEITVVGVEARVGVEFTEALTPAIQGAIPQAARQVVELLHQIRGKE
ncbi:MAG: hydrogenase maturation protease [Anaerolineae bacterium]|nr:hydrogenase maturation protease [Anaerolineae bacterium]